MHSNLHRHAVPNGLAATGRTFSRNAYTSNTKQGGMSGLPFQLSLLLQIFHTSVLKHYTILSHFSLGDTFKPSTRLTFNTTLPITIVLMNVTHATLDHV